MTQHAFCPPSGTLKGVDEMAVRALSTVAAQALGSPPAMARSHLAVQSALFDALVDPDPMPFDNCLEQLGKIGISDHDISTIHIPAALIQLGEHWVADQLGFASVSLASVRVQNYLRNGGLDWANRASLNVPSKASALLFVPEYEQHSLGATLLAGQLRAKGIDVVLRLSANTAEILKTAQDHDHDIVMLSSSRSETLALLCKTVLEIRQYSAVAPILLGGAVLDQIPNIRQKTGVDFIARDCSEAFEICLSAARRQSVRV